MRGLFYAMAALAVMGLAYWAYNENYKTQDALREAAQLQRQIGDQRQTLAILTAEWAYLNRPERLRELADMNFARLRLLPITPEQFVPVTQVPYPVPVFDLNEIINAIEVSGDADPATEEPAQ
ncbi:cell division protein FtsL [Litoreibacter roseus]|uniref:Cell division protein FtsL n=1 Tax=Litoreibacter roseus TaxID=2601869 RepID=A0A6N6JBJ2_9RHOB|nr:cell division protein FtsL [Litoreibacter roseus]GFE63545.1 cell division protein FtsL [Litoreibacter roseus]